MRTNKFLQAQLEVRKIKLGLSNEPVYREVLPSKRVNIWPVVFTVIMSLVLMVGVFAYLYYMI